MRLAESQSIPKITYNSCRGRHIRFTLYMGPSTSTGHLAHKDDVLTKPDARVDTTSSHCSSHTDRLNLFTHASDTRVCRSRIIQHTQRFTSNHASNHNKITCTCSLYYSHGVNLARRFRYVAYVPLLVLGRSLACPSKSGTVLGKVAFLATVVAPTIALHAWADIP